MFSLSTEYVTGESLTWVGWFEETGWLPSRSWVRCSWPHSFIQSEFLEHNPFLISMQKHLHCQVMSFGVTSIDPPGSLLFRMGEMGWERQAGICFCKAFWWGVWILSNEKSLESLKQWQTMIWYSFFKGVYVSRVANGMEGTRGWGKSLGGYWSICSLIYLFILQICAALQLHGYKALGVSLPTLLKLLGEKDNDEVNKQRKEISSNSNECYAENKTGCYDKEWLGREVVVT